MIEAVNEMELLRNYYSIYSTIHNDIKDIIKSGYYEIIILDLMNASKEIFPGRYIHLDKQAYAVDKERGENVDRLLAERRAESGYREWEESNPKEEGVTYDDHGKLIPLSKRYDRSNSDRRYSLGPVDAAADATATVPATVDTLPTKAHNILQQAQNLFVRNIAKAIGVAESESAPYLSNVVNALSRRYLERGKLPDGEKAFNRLYDGVIAAVGKRIK